ncbi:oligopeptide:H+ symporter [Burkholderiaceae bacterium DAT-1]|nr:oligopeptide:H+ symporter [Burkholderiaceae bacterium DAT-1]
MSHAPEGTGALFFIQIFATLGYAVLQSTLILYATKRLGFTTEAGSALTGLFGAFNYGLHMFGGYMGGRLMSNRNLFLIGMVLQFFGCATISMGTVPALYAGLGMFLTGSGLNVTCINMMLTQRFEPHDIRREGAFLWNYAGMNIGFFVGFTVAGYLHNQQDYRSLFMFATVGNAMAAVLSLFFWKHLKDISTPLLQVSQADFRKRLMVGVAIVIGLVPLVWYTLQHADDTSWILKLVCGFVWVALCWMTYKHPDQRERGNMWAYLILWIGSLVFWTLYQMSFNGLNLFAERNVDRMMLGIQIAPQWVQNINTVVIVVGGPLMSLLFTRLRARGWKIDVPKQFSISLLLMGIGFLVLPVGIAQAGVDGKTAFVWLLINYVCQALGELLISPVGYAMVGQLAPRQHQGVMMGAWMLVTGLASLLAGDFSGKLPDAIQSSNPVYASQFMQLGTGCVVVGLVLIALIPTLRRLISTAPADQA